jgi:hypothetical protein
MGQVLGSPLEPEFESFNPDSKSTVRIYVDAVIFQNGDVWGPDNLQYYTVIEERHSATESFVAEVAASKKAGADLQSTAVRIENDASSAKGRSQATRAHYAQLLQASPNPEATLEQLKNHPVPPKFRHIGEL